MKSRLFTAAALLGALQVLPAAAQDAWKFTTMMPLTGSNAGYSQELKLGFEIALEEINRKGGIKGRPVQLNILDTQSNPGQVATLVRQACDEALIVLGPALTNEARVAFPVANSMKCPSIAPAASGAGLTTGSRPWTFSMLTPSNVTTPLAVNAVIAKVKPTKSVVFVEKADSASNDYAEISNKTLAAAKVPGEMVAVSSTDVDFGPAMTRATGANPDLIVISSMERAAVGLLKEFRKSQMRSNVLLTQSAWNAVTAALPPDVLENVYRYSQSDPGTSDDPRVKEFVKTFQAKSGGRPPSIVGILPYDLLMVAKDAVERGNLKGDAASRVADRQKFIEALAATKDWQGLGGKMSMSPDGFMVGAPIVLVYRAGKWERVASQ
ncbi:MAG: ABC transporter substrate-binding protein [Pseudomonadota bacterium]